MNPMVTRCPKCGTAFRITSTQLESAKGAVRCGSCLNIFKAQDHLVKQEAPASTTPVSAPLSTPISTPAPAPQAAASTAASAATASKPKVSAASTASSAATAESLKPVIDKQKALEDEDDILISDDMEQVEKDNPYDFDGFVDLNMQPKQAVSLFEREIRYEPEEELEQTDESWAESLLDDDEDTTQTLRKSVSTSEATPSKAEIAAPVEPSHEPEQSPHYEAPIFSLVSEPNEQEQAFSDEFLKATGFSEQAPKATDESTAFASSLFNEETEPEPEPEPQQSGKKPVKSTKIRAFDTSRAALLMNIIPAPVEFTSRRMRSWYQRRLWPSLALLMALLLIVQVAYFKFDYFSRIEPFRTGYALACSVLNCKVQEQVDVHQIGINNLIVRSHPTAQNALIVDAILINNASFEQPFPDLVLAFSTIDETPVASRRFTPKEYLAGELAGMKRIPHKQPVHITLELADPGPDAPNYHLSIP